MRESQANGEGILIYLFLGKREPGTPTEKTQQSHRTSQAAAAALNFKK